MYNIGDNVKVVKILKDPGIPYPSKNDIPGSVIRFIKATGKISATNAGTKLNYNIKFDDEKLGIAGFMEEELEAISDPSLKLLSKKGDKKMVKKVVTSAPKHVEPKKTAAKKVENDREPTVKTRITKKIIDSVRKEMNLIGLEKEQEIILMAAENDFPSLLIGETGIGKTYLLRHIAEKLGKKAVRMSLNGEVGINELVGKWLVKDGGTYWQDGVLVDCMRHGWWIILDEINAALPEVLFCLNALLDDSRSLVMSEKDGECVTPHADFRVFATMNPPEEYAGTKELNKALLSRFPVVLLMENYKPLVELEILKYQSKIETEIGMILVDIGNIIRKLKNERKIWYTCSTRDLVNYARLLTCNDNSLGVAFAFSILNKASGDDRKLIMSTLKTQLPVKMDWSWSKEVAMKKLSSDLQMNIEKLQQKKQHLSMLIGDLENRIKILNVEVQK